MPIKKVMVCDDSPTERAYLENLLKKKGFDVILVDSGGRPSSAPSRQAGPHPHGCRHARSQRLPGHPRDHPRESTKHIPVIICTTKTRKTDKIWGLRQGAKDYVTKPSTKRTLIDKIKSSAAGAARLGATDRSPRVPDLVAEAASHRRDPRHLSSKLGFQWGRQLVRGPAPGERSIPMPPFIPVRSRSPGFAGSPTSAATSTASSISRRSRTAPPPRPARNGA